MFDSHSTVRLIDATSRGVVGISVCVEGTQVERQRHENLGGMCGWGLRWGLCPLPKTIFLYQSGEFLCIPGINYLPFLPFLPESEIRVELKFIGDRSSILGIIITPFGKLCAKMTKKCAENY